MSKLTKIYLFFALGATLLLVGGGFFLLVRPPDPVPVPLPQDIPKDPKNRESRARARQLEEESASRALLAAGSREGGSLSAPAPAPDARLKPWKETRSLPGGISARLKSFPDSDYLVFRLELAGPRAALDKLRRNDGFLLIELQDEKGAKILELKVRKKELLVEPGKDGRLLVSPLVAAACSGETAARAHTWQVAH
ncbi:MAG: hypothetical protein KC777_05265 [Cyanobacteria bacterium HKST-UBA02]|nr:hypothetical protein [Cyanobacteria bacterium HKST-UBA02]